LETGNNRQGLRLEDALRLAFFCKKSGVQVEGLATHFANIEDTTDHSFARKQLRLFREGWAAFHKAGFDIPVCHLANSAATLLWPDAQFDMVRTGISAYGMWPSSETFVSAIRERRERIALTPALTWKTRVAQVKTVPPNEFIGYGCTYRTTHEMRLAILPVGYFDGYDRKLSNTGYALIRGVRAPIRGRVCMNMTMVDVTDIPGVAVEEEVVLLGHQGQEEISAEQLGEWCGTINYEIVTRIAEHVPRIESVSQRSSAPR
jgi:alanine racemase